MLLGLLFAVALSGATMSLSAADCPPDPGSQFANGTFNGSSCWTLFDPQQLVTQTYWNGTFYAEISAGADYASVQLIQLIPVEAGKTYELSFLAWGTPADSMITMSLQRDTEPWESYGLWQDIPLPSGGTRFLYRFVCTETDPAARFTTFLGRIYGNIGLSALRMEDISCDQNNAVVNPTFDCDPAYPIGWQWYSSNPASTFGTTTDAYHGTYAATLTDLPGANYYDAYIQQNFIPWTANRWYLIRYWQKGTGTGYTKLQMKNLDTGYIPVWIDFTISPDYAVAPFMFRPTETTSNGQLTLFGGNLSGNLFVDPAQFTEVPMPDFSSVGSYEKGDFNGDGYDDILYSENRDRRLLWVAVSNGNDYLPFERWGEWFGPLTGKLVVGNWNGIDADSLRRDDVAIVATNEPALVRISDGTSFTDPGTNPWTANVSVTVTEARGGDVTGDGLDDIVTFTMGAEKDAYVLSSTGANFSPPAFWSGYCGVDGEQLFIADATGDGKDDVIAFVRGNGGAVFVGRSTGTSFQNGVQWAGLFCIHERIPLVGDFNGDGKWDVGESRHGEQPGDDRRIFVRLSTGSTFAGATQWHGYFAGATDWPSTGDGNGDGLTDLVSLEADYDYWFTQSWGANFGDVLRWYSTQEDIPYVPPLEEPDDPPTGVADDVRMVPSVTLWNYPSPFRDATTIAYTLPNASKANVAVYDASGRRVALLFDDIASSGTHEVSWRPAKNLSSGIYFARIQTGGVTVANKLIVLR